MMRWVHTAVIAVVALVFVIFAFQNLQTVTVAFLGFSVTLPLAVLFIVIYLLGMATGGSAWALVRWAWQGSKRPTVAQQ
jgi:putative membrane protein